MLSLLLTLLKIVGILILILLGLLLLTALALIFAPFRYELEAKCTSLKDLEVKGRFSWLLRFISVRGLYRNGEMSVWLKILGIPVFRLPETEELETAVAEGTAYPFSFPEGGNPCFLVFTDMPMLSVEETGAGDGDYTPVKATLFS